MPVFTDPMEVTLQRHVTMEPSPVGPSPVEHDFYEVYVHSQQIQNESHRLWVGSIGIQPNANFMPIDALKDFTYPQQQWIAEQAKAQHGNANPQPHINLPPPEVKSREEEEAEAEAQN